MSEEKLACLLFLCKGRVYLTHQWNTPMPRHSFWRKQPALWAPNAKDVYVIGEFNGWDEGATPLKRLGEGGIYAAFVENVEEGQMYKYMLVLADGRRLYKADPYANYAEMRPGTASRVYDLNHFKWADKGVAPSSQPLNSPITYTSFAFGAHTAKNTPSFSPFLQKCAPNFL